MHKNKLYRNYMYVYSQAKELYIEDYYYLGVVSNIGLSPLKFNVY